MAKQIKYTDEFRREAVAIYQKGNYSAAQVARKFGIHEHTMCRWIELYGSDRATPAHAASGKDISPEWHCVKQESDLTHPCVVECIHALKRHVGALEQLLLRQDDCSEAEK